MEKRDDFYIPEDVAEWINLKKSEYLSKLIQQMASDDFGFEEFHRFDKYIPGTIEGPDKVYESTDDNQKVRTYVRSYQENGVFHQIVQGVLVDDKESNAQVYVPILSFVTKKDEIVRLFSVGQVITRPTLN